MLLFSIPFLCFFLHFCLCRISDFTYVDEGDTCSLDYFLSSSPTVGMWHASIRHIPSYERDVFRVWGTDHHRGPGAEFAKIFPEVGVQYLDYGLKMRGLTMVPHMTHKQALGALIWERWAKFRRDFFEAHKNDEDLINAHAVLCSMPVHFCLLLLPFNKPIIAPFAFRFEGPYLPDRASSSRLFEVLQEMDRHPDVVMGGTNMYDTMYNNHFLGSRKQVWLPVVSHYIQDWDPTGWEHGKGGSLDRFYHPNPEIVGFENKVIVGPYRLSPSGFGVLDMIRREAAALGYAQRFPHIRDIYPSHYEYSQLCNHEVMLLLPYSVHAYGIGETRWMNIPMLIPSRQLYADWISKYHIMYERVSQPGVYEKDSEGLLFGHDYAWFWDPNGKQEYGWNNASSRSLSGSKSPIDDFSIADTTYWLSYADFYTWEAGVVQFDDIEDLLFKIETTDWALESQNLAQYNQRLHAFAQTQWKSVFSRLFSEMDASKPPQIPESYEHGMEMWKNKTALTDWNALNRHWEHSFDPAPSSGNFHTKNWLVVVANSGNVDNLRVLLESNEMSGYEVVFGWSSDGLPPSWLLLLDHVHGVGCFPHAKGSQRLKHLICNKKSKPQSNDVAYAMMGIVHALNTGGTDMVAWVTNLTQLNPEILSRWHGSALNAKTFTDEEQPVVDPIAAVTTRGTMPPLHPNCELFSRHHPKSNVSSQTANIHFVVNVEGDRATLGDVGPCVTASRTFAPTAHVSPLTFLTKTAFWYLVCSSNWNADDATEATMVWQLAAQRLSWEHKEPTALRPCKAAASKPSIVNHRETARLIKYLLQWVPPPHADNAAAITHQLSEDLVAAGFIQHRDSLFTKAYLIELAIILPFP